MSAKIRLTQDEQLVLMREALVEAERGLADGEAPIGCVIARRGEILVRGHNRVQATRRWTSHAEMIAFEKGGLPLDADDLVLVSSLEPCVMCTGAAMESKIALILFGLRAPADSGTGRVRPPSSPDTHAPEIIGDVLAAESRRLFERFVRGKEGTPEARYAEQLLALTAGDVTE